MAAFLVIQTRVSEPMLPLHLFKKRAFTGVQLAALGVSASIFALFLYLTLYLQGFLGHDPLEAGLRYLPVTVTNFVVAAATGALLSRVQARYLIGARPGHHGPGPAPDGRRPERPTTGPACCPASSSSAPAWACINPAIADVAVSVVPKEHSGMASGINDTFRQVGIAIGIAAWGAIFLGRGASRSRRSRQARPPRPERGRASWWRRCPPATWTTRSRRAPPGARAGVADAARQGFLAGFNEILMLGGILAVAGAVAAAVADPRGRDRAGGPDRGRAALRAGRARARARGRLASDRFSVPVTCPD